LSDIIRTRLVFFKTTCIKKILTSFYPSCLTFEDKSS